MAYDIDGNNVKCACGCVEAPLSAEGAVGNCYWWISDARICLSHETEGRNMGAPFIFSVVEARCKVNGMSKKKIDNLD